VNFTESFRLMLYGPAMINVESEPIVEGDFEDIARLRRYMVECMRRSDGVGLAAPQIGLFKQFVVIEKTENQVIDLVNPQITRMYGKELEDYESCLSIPPSGNDCLVPRVDTIHVEASTAVLPTFRKEFIFSGSVARIVQHEIDHLTGTFFVDRVAVSKKKDVLDRFEYWKQMRRAKVRYAEKEKHNVDAGIVAARGSKSRLP
jgi:peptide deformylase